jgi:Cft2 family RNA processing exonuclease
MNSEAPSLQLISGVGVKGPACFVVETGGKRLMLDLGEGPPPGLLPDVDGIGPIDALILTHGHKDHVGGLSLLPKLNNPPIYATEIVARELPLHASAVCPLPLRGWSEIFGIEVETGRNGHAPGGVWLRFVIGDGFLYTGDICVESILYAYDPPKRPARTALIDCSYGSYEKGVADCWDALAPFVARGPLLLPVPANGRGPELALALARHGYRDIFVDAAMMHALQRLTADAAASVHDDLGDELERLAAVARPIEDARGVMLAASADGASGATARCLAQWEHATEPAIVFTGYVPPGTPADRLIQNGRAQTLRWNVHPLLSDAVDLVRALRPQIVVPAFCDRQQLATLAAAFAPARTVMDGPVPI